MSDNPNPNPNPKPTTYPTLDEITSAAGDILCRAEELRQNLADQPDDFGEMVDVVISASTTLNQRLTHFAESAGENPVMDRETREELRGNLTAIIGFAELMLALSEGKRTQFHVLLDDIQVRGKALNEMLDLAMAPKP